MFAESKMTEGQCSRWRRWFRVRRGGVWPLGAADGV